MEETRKSEKASFPRRRTGCLTCKRRHVRCGEELPACSNCLNRGRECQYAEPPVPLRERRKRQLRAILPGEQEPWVSSCHPATTGTLAASWAVSRPLAPTEVDPFGSLPLKMDPKMQELFHSFFVYDPAHYMDAGFDSMLLDGTGSTLQDPFALQNAVLIAGVHYTWKRGSLLSFREVYLSNKIDTIRAVNAALVDPWEWRKGGYTRLIATLALAECCSGNLGVAETHLLGLASLLTTKNMLNRVGHSTGRSLDGDEELNDRYLTLVITFLVAVHSSRLEWVKSSLLGKPDETTHGWCRRDTHLLHFRLAAMRTLPAYFMPPAAPHNLRGPVDVAGVIANIRCTTRDLEVCMVRSDTPEEWLGPGLPKPYGPLLCLEMVKAHIHPYTRDGEDFGRSPVFSSLSGLTAATQLYLGVILGMLNVDWEPFKSITPYTVGVLIRDLRDGTGDMRAWDSARMDLWLWKAIAGWAGLAVLQGYKEAMESAFCWWIRQWSENSGLQDWRDAKEALGRVAWPHTVARGLDMEQAWQDILAD